MKRLITAGIAGLLMSWLMTTTAMAYLNPIPSQITLSGKCSTTALTATVLDSHGNPIPNTVVNWSITSSPSTTDTLGATSTTTDSNGVAHNTVNFDRKTAGPRVVRAISGDSSASATITFNCSHNGLPRTDTAPDTNTLPATFAFAGAALLVLLMGLGLGLAAKRARA
jgi:hypothetical protein